MTVPSLLKAPILSLFSSKFYLQVITRMQHTGILYLCVLTFFALGAIYIALNIHFSTISAVIRDLDKATYQASTPDTDYTNLSPQWQNFVDVVIQLPTIYIADGVADAKLTEYPHCITSLRDSQKNLMCLDMEKPISFKEYDIPFLLSKDRLMYNDPVSGTPQTIADFKHMGLVTEEVFDLDAIIQGIPKIPFMMTMTIAFILYPLLIAFTLFYGWVSANISDHYKLGLKYRDCLRVAAFANGAMITFFIIVIIAGGLAAIPIMSTIAILLPIYCQYKAYSTYHNLLKNRNNKD